MAASRRVLSGSRCVPVGLAALCASLVLLGVGCADLSLGDSSGSGSAAVVVVPAQPSPRIEITTPARASFLVPGRVAVEGRALMAVSSTAPLQIARLNGVPVPLESDGTFRGFVDIVPGMNVISASCSDAAGLSGSTAIAVLSGDWAAPSVMVEPAGRVRIDNTSLGAVGKIIEGVIRDLDITTLLKGANPIFATNLLWVQLWIDIQQAQFQDVSVLVEARPDGIHVDATLTQAAVDVTVQADLGLGAVTSPELVGLTADSMRLTGRLTAAVRPDKTFDVSTADAQITFQSFVAHPTSQLLVSLEPLLRGAVRDAIRGLLVDLIQDDLNTIIDDKLAEGLNPQTPFDILGKPFLYEVMGRSVAFDSAGFTVEASFNSVQPQPIGAAIGTPGSYRTIGIMPAMGASGGGVVATVDDDMMNRLLYGMWANGVFDIDFDEAFLAQQQITLPFDLTLGALADFIPELSLAGPPDAKVALRARPLLPPIMKVAGQPDLLEVHLGEVRFDILVDLGRGYEPLLETIIHGSAGMTVQIGSAGLEFSVTQLPRFEIDIEREPIVELDDRKITLMLSVVLGTSLIPQLLNELDVIEIPYLKDLSVFNTFAYPDGPSQEHLTVTADMAR